jgi:hypothetical protein
MHCHLSGLGTEEFLVFLVGFSPSSYKSHRLQLDGL